MKILTVVPIKILSLLAVFAMALSLTTANISAQPARASLEALPVLEEPPLREESSFTAQSGTRISLFRNPVVEGATISGYFDHSSSPYSSGVYDGIVVFHNGSRNQPGAGFYFTCSNPYMNDWVGCMDNVSGEGACRNSRELWYDGHHGTDYEFASNWHTGNACNLSNNYGLTKRIYAPAAGRVLMAGTDASRPGNGWHIRMQHDMNKNGNYYDDNIRSVYLHFTAGALNVSAGQIIPEGYYLGLGGSTGYSSSPHLHFEVQRSSDAFYSTIWSVDPYGWTGSYADPYAYENAILWQAPPPPPPVPQPNKYRFPAIMKVSGCSGCGELLVNGGFEDGSLGWTEGTPGIIVNTNTTPDLPITPAAGSGMARMSGRESAVDSIYQDFEVPDGLGQVQLRYRLLITSELTGGAEDYFYARVRLPDGTVIQELEQLDNTSAAGTWVQRSFSLPSVVARHGQTVRINFKGASSSGLTTFYLDQVSITASP